MKKVLLSILVCTAFAAPAFADDAAQPAADHVAVSTGKLLKSTDGGRLGIVAHVAVDGSPQVIVDGRLVTIPASTLSFDNGSLVTSLTKSKIIKTI